MAPGKFDFSIWLGTDGGFTLRLKNGDNVVDITDLVFYAQARAEVADDVVIDLDPTTVGDPVDGLVRIHWTRAGTLGLDALARLNWTLLGKDTANDDIIIPYLEGQITLKNIFTDPS
jgi:hypothetical protein